MHEVENQHMQELAKQYKESIRLLSKRISELEGLTTNYKKLIRAIRIQIRKETNQNEINSLRSRLRELHNEMAFNIPDSDRLKPLRNMRADLYFYCREIRNYYNGGWYRSAEITFNNKRRFN